MGNEKHHGDIPSADADATILDAFFADPSAVNKITSQLRSEERRRAQKSVEGDNTLSAAQQLIQKRKTEGRQGAGNDQSVHIRRHGRKGTVWKKGRSTR